MQNGVIDGKLSSYKAERTICQEGKYLEHRQNLIKSFEYCEEKIADKQCTRELYIKLLSQGPMIVAMDAEFAGFSRYKPSDNFEPAVAEYCGSLNHAIVAVGIVTENDEDYLIVRNSWGTNWGMNGYFKMSTKKACGLVDYAWFPHVQEEGKPFDISSQPAFNSECEMKGKTIHTETGVSDFEKSIGKNAESYYYDGKDYIYFNFYKQKNCEGEPFWNYENDFKCFANSYILNPDDKIYSASAENISAPWGCIMHFSDTCFDGNKTIICNSIPDLSKTDFQITQGSFFIPKYSIKNVVFFDDIKYQGNGFGIKGRNMVNMGKNDPKLNEIMARAKSVLIVIHDPNAPLDPDW